MNQTTALVARPGAVAGVLAGQAPVLLAVVLPPCLASLLLGDWGMALSLLPQVVVLGAMTLFRGRWGFPHDLRQVEALCAFALLFLTASALVVSPFLVLGMPPLDAVFEAVSGITSTGLSVARETQDWPISAHLLRGWIQWCGGFAIAFAGLAIFTGSPGASLAMGGSSISTRDNLLSLRTQAKKVLWSYTALSVVAVIACLLVLPNWWEAISIALAAVSTGGFAPRANSLADYTPLAQGVVIAICVFASIALIAYVQILRDGLRGGVQKSHALATFGLIVIGTILFVTIDRIVTGAPPAQLYRGALNFVSGFTTAGFSVGDVSSHVALLPLILIAMVIGGDVGSTGGGIKVGRVVLLARMVALSILRVRVPPSAVTYLRDGPGKVTADRVIAVATLLVLYLTTALAGWTVFLVSGAPPLASLFEVISALSTVGLSQGLTGADMAAHLKVTLIVIMLLGRLEFVALIVLILPRTWWQTGEKR